MKVLLPYPLVRHDLENPHVAMDVSDDTFTNCGMDRIEDLIRSNGTAQTAIGYLIATTIDTGKGVVPAVAI